MKMRTATALVATQTATPVAKESLESPLLVFPGGAPLKTLQNASGLISRVWTWFRERQTARVNSRRLHVAASVSLGEKRFIAVIEVDGQQFLIGGGATTVSLLAQVDNSESLGKVLEETTAASKKQPVKRVRPRVAMPLPEPSMSIGSFDKVLEETIVAPAKQPKKQVEQQVPTPLPDQSSANESSDSVPQETVVAPKKVLVKRVRPRVSKPSPKQLSGNDSFVDVPKKTIAVPKKQPMKLVSLPLAAPVTEQLRERA